MLWTAWQGNEGLYIVHVAQTLVCGEEQTRAAAHELLEQGLVYTTVDEEHFCCLEIT